MNMNSTIQKSVDYKVFTKIVQSDPKVTIEEMRGDGDIVFSVQMSDMGLKYDSISDNIVTDTDFFNNFVGEYVVRKNIEQFLDILFGIDHKSYDDVVCANEHTDFGMVLSKDTIKFSMHISLVQRIMTEDFRKAMES